MVINFDWNADRKIRTAELDRQEKDLQAIYQKTIIKSYPDSEKRITAFEKICEKMGSKLFQRRTGSKVVLPFILHNAVATWDLSILLKAACLRVTSIKINEETTYLSLSEVWEALTDAIKWEDHFLELPRDVFNDKYYYKPHRTRLIIDQIRRDLTGFIGEFCEHRHNSNDFSDFLEGFRKGLEKGGDAFDFKYKKNGQETDVKTLNDEGKCYIFSDSTFEGEPKVLLLGLVRFHNERAFWEGGIKTDSAIIQKNPTFAPFRIDKSGKSSAVYHISLRPYPAITGSEPYQAYYGVQFSKSNSKAGR